MDRAGHVGHFFGALIDEEDDEGDLGVVGGDGVGDVLQEHRLAGARRRHDEAALAFADGGEEVDDARRLFVGLVFEAQALLGIERGQGVEEGRAQAAFGALAVDRVDAPHGEVAIARVAASGRGTQGAEDAVADAQVEAPDLGG